MILAQHLYDICRLVEDTATSTALIHHRDGRISVVELLCAACEAYMNRRRMCQEYEDER